MGCLSRVHLFIFNQIKSKNLNVRFLYTVHHNLSGGIFFIKLDNNLKAVLSYKANGRVLDMLTINVPDTHGGQGLARLLTETAITYVIDNDFLMILTCPYIQNYYLQIGHKDEDIKKRIVGPASLLKQANSGASNPRGTQKSPDS